MVVAAVGTWLQILKTVDQELVAAEPVAVVQTHRCLVQTTPEVVAVVLQQVVKPTVQQVDQEL